MLSCKPGVKDANFANPILQLSARVVSASRLCLLTLAANGLSK